VGATITAHHLYATIDDLLAGGLDPHLYCKPIVKFDRDRRALREAACSGDPAFFFGSDSAPHPRRDKEGTSAAAGVFSSAVLLPVLAEVFTEEGRLSMLDDFTGRFGAEFYGLEVSEERIELIEEAWRVPEEICGAVPFLAGKTLRLRRSR
jgi:dihydroorotase